jgi:hypothetical protein
MDDVQKLAADMIATCTKSRTVQGGEVLAIPVKGNDEAMAPCPHAPCLFCPVTRNGNDARRTRSFAATASDRSTGGPSLRHCPLRVNLVCRGQFPLALSEILQWSSPLPKAIDRFAFAAGIAYFQLVFVLDCSCTFVGWRSNRLACSLCLDNTDDFVLDCSCTFVG